MKKYGYLRFKAPYFYLSIGDNSVGDVVGPASATDNAIVRFDSTTGKLIQNTSQVTIDDNGVFTLTGTTENVMTITTNFGAGASDNMFLLQSTNAAYDRPMLRIIAASAAGGCASIRIDAPNPNIELVESDQVSPAGKYEVAIQGDIMQLNGRNAADTSFEVFANLTRFSHPTNPGSMAIGGIGSGDKANAVLEAVAIGSQSLLMCSSTIGASSGDILQVDASGNLIINNRGTAVSTRIEGDTDANLFFVDGTNDKVNIGFNTAGSSKFNVKGEAQFGIASTTTGRVRLGKSTAAGITIIEPGAPGSDVTLTCPAVTGTVALTTDTPICSRVTSDFAVTSNTTLANITGLTFTATSSTAYRFEAHLFTTSNVAGGVKAAIAGTATATNIVYEGMTTAAGAITQTRASALATAVGAITAITSGYIYITGLIEVNAGGTLTVQFAQNASSASASTVLRGSYFAVQKVA